MRLVVIQEPGTEPGQFQPKIFDLKYDPLRPVLRVGRHSTNDIVLSDASISRYHSEIEVRPNGIMITDLGSSNGTFINNQRLDPNSQAFVRPGEQLRIGNVITILEQNAAPAQPRPVAPGYQRPPEPPRPRPAYNEPPVAQFEEVPFATNRPAQYRQDYPVESAPAAYPARRAAKPKSGPNWFVIGVLLGMLILGLGVLAFIAYQVFTSNQGPSPVALPSNVFASPANAESVLGVTMAHPSGWQRSEAANGSQVIFSKPGTPTTAVTLEKTPGLIITTPGLTPEAAVRQYLANVQANSQGYRILAGPAPTTLKDSAPGYFARAVFSTTTAPVVTNYTVNVLAFRCGPSLYFASAGAEGKDYTGATQQDLEAAIANFKC